LANFCEKENICNILTQTHASVIY